MITSKVETLAFGGEGIVRHDKLVIFVPLTAPGDEITLEIVHKKKNFARGKLLSINTPSSLRTTPLCPYFGTCGGCQLQHLLASAQLSAKRTFILDALKRIGQITLPDLLVIPSLIPFAYRRHIRLKLHAGKIGFTLKTAVGSLAVFRVRGLNPSEFVPVQYCPLFLPLEHPLFETLNFLIETLSNEGIKEGSLRLIKCPLEKFILAFDFQDKVLLPVKKIQEHYENNPSWQGIVMQSPQSYKTWGDVHCEIETLGVKAQFSPFGFVQNHPEQSENLYRTILDIIPPECKTVLDLYCGIGLTSILLGKLGKNVIGIESHKHTVELAKKNGKPYKSVTFYEGLAEELGIQLLKEKQFDAVLCNPPRTGLDPAIIEALLDTRPPCILYVSCMPSTLARDLRQLTQAHYEIEFIQGFDLFPQTTHVETLVKLKKRFHQS
jgi:23S rRNA (uracil1939-C5)-methyltransferase